MPTCGRNSAGTTSGPARGRGKTFAAGMARGSPAIVPAGEIVEAQAIARVAETALVPAIADRVTDRRPATPVLDARQAVHATDQRAKGPAARGVTPPFPAADRVAPRGHRPPAAARVLPAPGQAGSPGAAAARAASVVAAASGVAAEVVSAAVAVADAGPISHSSTTSPFSATWTTASASIASATTAAIAPMS